MTNYSSEDDALSAKLQKEIESGGDEEYEGNPTVQHLEYKIQTRRILQIFDNVIKCCQLTFCLENMIKNDYIMNEAFDYQTKEDIVNFCDCVNEGSFGDVLHQGMSQQSLHMSSMFEKIMKSDLKTEISHFLEHVPEYARDFIDSLMMLKDVVKNRIQMTAAKEMEKEKMLHRLYLSNLKNEDKIHALQEKISEQEAQSQVLSDKYAKIERYKHEIEMMKERNKDEIDRHIYESDKVMLRQCRESETIQAELQENVEKVTDRYHKTLDANLRTERALREKKVKITQQLQQWIAKYDVDVGTRSKELAELTEKLNEEEAAFNKWYEEEFVPQEKNYIFLMNEKEEEERRVHEERLCMFMMNRAARILQRHWRAYIIRKKSKKGRKGRRAKK